jgi:hypothetical protein
VSMSDRRTRREAGLSAPVRVYQRPLLQKISSNLNRIDHNHRMAQHIEVNNPIICPRRPLVKRKQKRKG